jgi:hypothetical protein
MLLVALILGAGFAVASGQGTKWKVLAFTFVDARITPNNNPACLLFRMAKVDAADRIENLISIGLKSGDSVKLEYPASVAPKEVAIS